MICPLRIRSRHSALHALALLLVASPPAGAQLAVTWARTHDAPPMQLDMLVDITADASGNVWVTGGSWYAPPQDGSIETVKYDAAGNLLWRARYDSLLGGGDRGVAIAKTLLGAVVVAGHSDTGGLNPFVQQTVVKYDALGAQLWAYQYGAQSSTGAALVDSSGFIYLGGYEISGGNSDLCVRKIDGNGILQWTATYAGVAGGHDRLTALALAQNGDIVAGGAIASLSGLAVMRVSSNGVVLWAHEVDGSAPGVEFIESVAVDTAGNAYAAGSLFTGTNNPDQALIAYGPAGNHLWTRTRDGSAHGADAFTKVAIDPLGRVVAAGRLAETGMQTNFSVVVYDTAGTLVWSREWDGAAHSYDGARGLVLDSASSVFVCGGSRLNPTADAAVYECRVLGYDAYGVQLFNGRYGNGVQSEEVLDIEKGPGSSLYVGGTHDWTQTGGDYITLRLDPLSTSFCGGDGSGTACPCGNNVLTLRGCGNSTFTAGALLSSSGIPGASVGTDTWVLTAYNVSGAGMFLQGTGQQASGAGIGFGDGLLCLGGTLTRLGVVFPTGASASYPGGLTPNPIHIAGGTASGDVRHYQCWYRDAITYCTVDTFNLTQGLTIAWGP